MIPLRDIIPSRATPCITVSIVILNAAAWLFELELPRQALPAFLQTYGVVSADFRAPALVTSMFLHASWLHVIDNMWSLWIFGDNVEARLGRPGFLTFYLLCGIVASLGQVAMDPTSTRPAIGASGAIAGVMGAYVVLYPRSRVLTLVPLVVFWEIVEVPAVILLGCWVVIQVISAGAIAVTAGAASAGIALMAPAAGFVAGIVGVLAFRLRRRSTQYWAGSENR